MDHSSIIPLTGRAHWGGYLLLLAVLPVASILTYGLTSTRTRRVQVASKSLGSKSLLIPPTAPFWVPGIAHTFAFTLWPVSFLNNLLYVQDPTWKPDTTHT